MSREYTALYKNFVFWNVPLIFKYPKSQHPIIRPALFIYHLSTTFTWRMGGLFEKSKSVQFIATMKWILKNETHYIIHNNTLIDGLK